MNKHKEMATAVAGNLKRLMEAEQISQAQLAKRTGIGQSTLSNLLDASKPLEINPRMTTLMQLGAHFNVPAWLLMMGELPLELLKSGRMAKLIQNYADSSDEGRHTIDRIAESEVRYAVSPGKAQFSKQA